jgi:hypothetical protein
MIDEALYVVTMREKTDLVPITICGEVIGRVGVRRFVVRVAPHRVRDFVREPDVEKIETLTARDKIWLLHHETTTKLREMKACLAEMNLTEDERDMLVGRLYFAEGIVLDIASVARSLENQKT